MNKNKPTKIPELNDVLSVFINGVKDILGTNFVGAYLHGSFASGGWDEDSDVDFQIVIGHQLSDNEVTRLQRFHGDFFKSGSKWATHLDGSYFPKNLIKTEDKNKTPIWYLDNGHDQMVLSDHDNTLVLRKILLENGIVLDGPEVHEIIDPVSDDALKSEIKSKMKIWRKRIHDGSYKIDNQWAYAYVTLSFCRMIHTLETGKMESKFESMCWARDNLDSSWADHLTHCWDNRPNPSQKVKMPAEQKYVDKTLEFMDYIIEKSERIN